MICNTKISIPHIEKFDRSRSKNPLKPLLTKGLQRKLDFCWFFKIYTFSRGAASASFINLWKVLLFTGIILQNLTVRFESIQKDDADKWNMWLLCWISIILFVPFLWNHCVSSVVHIFVFYLPYLSLSASVYLSPLPLHFLLLFLPPPTHTVSPSRRGGWKGKTIW